MRSARLAPLKSFQVLNALRHHSYLHPMRGRHLKAALSAQRLTASQLSTLMVRAVTRTPTTCSTPYGITAIYIPVGSNVGLPTIGCSTPYGITAIYMKHHIVGCSIRQCSTPYGITAIYIEATARCKTDCFCAQRLTASQLSTSARGALQTARRSAQRLTASQLSTYRTPSLTIQRFRVLNALRHHSYLHSVIDPSTFSGSLRAQRLTASQLST